MRPETYLALDSRNCKLLDKRGVAHKVKDWTSYLQFLKEARTRLPERPYEFSYAAYAGEPDSRYWVFQGNPKRYDVVGALRAGAVKTWQVNQRKKDIHRGDKVIIWVTGDTPGCYALATVTSEVHTVTEDPKEASYWKKPAKSSLFEGVTLCIDTQLWDNPVSKVEIGGQPAFSDFPAGRQGTNLAATKAQYDGILALARGSRPPTLPSRNIILYGPPGTGKTYTLRNEYMERFTERAAALSRGDFAADLVADLAWWQVITMVMLDLKTSKVSGILEHPLMQARIRRANNRTPRAAVWAHLQMHTKADCPEVKYAKRYEPLLFSKDAKSVWSIDDKLATEEAPDLVETLQRYRGYTPPGQGAVIKRYEFTTFHQAYSYEDFVEGIKPVMFEEVAETPAYEVKAGIFKTMVNLALADPGHNYALLIDEISRGNVASIFGELITLIEDDKRQGEKNELRARLPYSRDEFVVPRNLYIIGAMNTADRSVEALDTALRRRFTFVAIPPQPELIQQPKNLDVDLQKLLSVINARIEKLLDKDHCIGHSYFMGIFESSNPLAELRNVFATKILPLMEEYFYGDPAKIGMVLGVSFVSRKDDAAEWAKGDWGMDEFEERHVYTLRNPMTMKDEDFRAVYE